VLVKLNYRIRVYINFAQSRIPALVCSLQSEYACHEARSQDGNGGNVPHNSKDFKLINIWNISQRKTSAQINETASRNLSYFRFQPDRNLYLTFCNQWRQMKTVGVTFFAAVFGTPACCILSHLMVMWASFQDHRKLIFDYRGCYKYPCFYCQRSLKPIS